MKIAVMQPYIFPYVGYFQLINSVNRFVVLDDVNYINRGWINRNRILVNNSGFIFTLPLNNGSQNKHICDIYLVDDNKWKTKLLKTIELAYRKAPFYLEVIPLINKILLSEKKNVSAFILNSLQIISDYLDIKTQFVPTSLKYNNAHLKAQDKIIDICINENANQYFNLAGGMDLYSKEKFREKNIQLNFIKMKPIQYNQFGKEFIPSLSIIDVLMFNDKNTVISYLNDYELL